MGKLIVIEGLDGSGKATQTGLLAKSLTEEGILLRKVTFPDYESDSSALIKMYLGGEFGTDPGDVNAYAASAFYAVDRYASFKQQWGQFYRDGGLVLADRYATSNAIHQAAKLPQNEREEYIRWLEDFEYGKLEIPKPDLVVYLDVEPDVSQKLLVQRYGGTEKRDIHEKDLAYLQQCRDTAMWCIDHLGWNKIACTRNGGMRTPEDIACEVRNAVKEIVCSSGTSKQAT